MGIEFKITVHKAEGLMNAESGGLLSKKDRKSDPFVQIFFRDWKGKTKTIANTLDPDWSEEFSVPCDKSIDNGSEVTFEVYDYEKVGASRPLGYCVVRLNNLLKKGSISQEWFKLQPKKGEPATGRINVSMSYVDPDHPPEKEPAGGAAGAGASTAEEAEEAPEEGEAGGTQSGGSGIKGKFAGRKGKILKKQTPRSTKVVDWQVRFHIVEARNLSGSNVDPVCKVSIGNARKQTKVHKTNANPHFDEYMVFNFHESSQKLFEQVVDLKVFNAKKIFKDALIGSFSIDIGTIYDEDNHQFPFTWVMLTDIDSGDASVKGYLKVTMTVLGPGDEMFVPEDVEDDEDFENKVLRPFGAELETIDLCFKMYSAEDIPQKDLALQTGVKAIDKITGQADKMYCDPYAKVLFAGKFNLTKVIDDTYFPEWNQEIHILAQIPSMLNKIKVQVWDSDTPAALAGFDSFRGGDDIIATHLLNISQISSLDSDHGFLPTFGPCYIPLYGGPRKFQAIYDDHFKRLDEGLGEGMAYRGRVLCEVGAKPLGEDKLGETADLLPSDIERCKSYLHRIEYHLRVILGEVNFLDPEQFSKGDITFEVSIGMIGNLDAVPDDQPNPVNSTTFPSPGLSDGSWYRTLAFDNKKPCVELRSEWEDVLFRISALNQYKAISVNLTRGLEAIEDLVTPTPSGEFDERKLEKARDHLMRILNTLITDCERPLPALPEGHATTLDLKLFEKREREKNSTAFEAKDLRDNLENRQVTPQDCVASLKTFIKHLSADAIECQNPIPDIIIWMLHKGERVASNRFPVSDFMWSNKSHERGILFGIPQKTFLRSTKPRPKKALLERIPGQIQVRIFFGPRDTMNQWPKLNGRSVILAESYENQRYLPVKGWGDILLPTDPPKFSDKKGKEKKLKADFKEPEGWIWDREWYIDPDIPDIDIYGDQDLVIIEVFENERRQPIVGWSKTLLPTDPPSYGDRAGTEKRMMEEVELPKGWKWRTSWQIDMTRACDKDGWEYASNFSGDFHASEKRFDFVRRRRWWIERIKDPEYTGSYDDAQDHGDGWLYAIDFGQKFRPTHSTVDAVRRRRWHRELIAKDPSRTLADVPSEFPAAGTFFAFQGQATYQFRAHLYQGRDLPAEDSNAFSDAFARIIFCGACHRTIVIEKSVSPMWDQTVVFEVTLHGNSSDPKALFDEIRPRIVVELYDKDAIGDDDLLGRFTAFPVYRDASNPLPPILAWFSSKRLDEDCGEVLAAFEVIPTQDAPKFPLPKPTSIKEPLTRTTMDVIRLPEDVRPELEPCEIEVLTWGLRNLKKVYFLTANKPSVTVECGGVVRETEPIKSMKKYQNFESNIISFPIELPVKEIYAPPLNILVYDNRKFGAKPLVGSISLKSLKQFRARLDQIHGELDFMKKDQRGASIIASSAEESVPVQDENVALMPPEEPLIGGITLPKINLNGVTSIAKKIANAAQNMVGEPMIEPDDTVDWWNKFFASVGEEQTGQPYDGDLIEVYPQPLESRYDLEAIIKTFTLYKGKTGQEEEKGLFKGNFRVLPLNQQPAPMNMAAALAHKDERGRIPHPWGHLPDKGTVEVMVRVYIVRGIELQPRDSNGKSDPFCVLTFGKNKPINDKKNYIARNLNPLFGRVFEMNCILPRDADLLIQVFDYDMIGANDLIGETKIDLETRYLTRKRATVGLAKTYRAEGLSAWRDSLKPTEILQKFCEDHILSEPVYTEYIEGQPVSCSVAEINEGALFTPTVAELYESKEIARENAALMVLHFVGLVRDHIETRTLHDPMQPEMDQGKLQMWVDIFPKSEGAPPPPVDISPRKPKKYELRVVIYNTVEVDFADVAITGEEMSDIYVKGLIRGMEDKRQKTDVHYRSLNGEGNFNWRQVFPFEYVPAEERVHISKRAHIFSSEFEVNKVPPVLSLQLWDADIFGPDEFIGSVDIDLIDLNLPARRSNSAKIRKEGTKGSGISLFNKKRIQGWYACTNPINPDRCSGKIEVEIELLTELEVLERPAGQARDEPNQNPHLEPPKRPATSFLWFTSPWKTLKFIIWKHYKWYIIGFIILLLLVAAIVIFIYTAPSSVMDTLVSSLDPRTNGIANALQELTQGN